MLLILRARWVLPIDRPPIEGGFVTIDGDRIVAVGAYAPGSDRIEDLGDVVLLPGLVNAHTHLEFSGLARPLGERGSGLPEWIRLVIGDRKRGDRDAAAGIAAGLAESLACGVTTIGEIATLPAAHYMAAGLAPAVVQFQEAIGFSAGRVNSVFGDLVQRLDAVAAPAGLSPHAPYTVHPRLLERIVGLAKNRALPVAMHLAESTEELQLLARGDGPFRELLEERSMWDAEAIPADSRPLDYLGVLAEAPRSLVIHGNYLAADEIDFIGQRRDRMSVVYCPRTHDYFGHASYPLAEMREAGVRVALGTDSRASNPDLSLLSELRWLRKRHAQVGPEEALRMATLNGAEALGLGPVAGSLTEGKRADVIAMPCDHDCDDPYASILEGTAGPLRIWLGGAIAETAPPTS